MGRRRAKLVIGTVALAVVAACQPVKPPGPPPPPARTLLPPPPDQAPPPNSPTLTTDMTVVTGLTRPWDLGFVPGDVNTMFFTQRAGPVSVKIGAAAPVILGTPPGAVQNGEAGVMGMAVDPNFAANRFIYVCYSTASDNRVVRFTISNPVVPATSLTNPLVLIGGVPLASSHNGCRVRFGPDGALWVTTGDAASGTNPQDGNSLGGKVLRVNPADGSPAAGNPAGSRVWTYGHRNVQGIAFQPGTGQPYSTEHGPDINDEVNRLEPGGNGGWDPVPGYNQGVPMTDLVKFPSAMIPAWRSGDSFTLAPSGATFLSGTQWEAWNGALVVAFQKDSKARVMFLDADGNVSFATRILEHGSRLRSVVQGPDGNLYVTTDTGTNDAIWRVTPS